MEAMIIFKTIKLPSGKLRQRKHTLNACSKESLFWKIKAIVEGQEKKVSRIFLIEKKDITGGFIYDRI